MEKEVRFSISVITTDDNEGTLYYEQMPSFPVPRVGENVFVPGPAMGWWAVKEVFRAFPSMGAMTPTMHIDLKVEWSPINGEKIKRPRYDADRGWVRDETET